MGANQEPHFLINDLEDTARNNIIKLDQKLRGLRAEVEAKIHALALLPEDQKQNSGQGLATLLAEIDQAIKGMNTLVQLVVVDEGEHNKDLLQSDEIKQLNKMVSDNLEKIIKINNEF